METFEGVIVIEFDINKRQEIKMFFTFSYNCTLKNEKYVSKDFYNQVQNLFTVFCTEMLNVTWAVILYVFLLLANCTSYIVFL